MPKLKNLSDAWSVELTTAALDLQSWDKTLLKQTHALLQQLDARVEEALRQVDIERAAQSAARLRALQEQIDATFAKNFGAVQAHTFKRLYDVGEFRQRQIVSVGKKVFGANIIEPALSPKELKVLVDTALVEGAPLAAWWNKQAEQTRFALRRELQLGVLQGLTNQQMVQRIRGQATSERVLVELPNGKTSSAPVYKGGVLSANTRNTETLVITSTASIANAVDQEVYSENDDVVKGQGVLTTLDSRTSKLCIARTGASWDMQGNPLPESTRQEQFPGPPPWHPRCRSKLYPITFTWEELVERETGKKSKILNSVPDSVRASMDGEIANNVHSFDDWLEAKGEEFARNTLGPARYDLWAADKITTSDLVDRAGEALTVEELEALAEGRDDVGTIPLTKPPVPLTDDEKRTAAGDKLREAEEALRKAQEARAEAERKAQEEAAARDAAAAAKKRQAAQVFGPVRTQHTAESVVQVRQGAAQLSARSKETIKEWQESYSDVTDFLRGVKRTTPLHPDARKRIEDRIEALDDLFAESKLQRADVFRGVQGLDDAAFKALTTPGNEVEMASFTSWSRDHQIARSFAQIGPNTKSNNVVFRASNEGVDIGKAFDNEGDYTVEDELLVGRGAKYRVTATRKVPMFVTEASSSVDEVDRLVSISMQTDTWAVRGGVLEVEESASDLRYLLVDQIARGEYEDAAETVNALLESIDTVRERGQEWAEEATPPPLVRTEDFTALYHTLRAEAGLGPVPDAYTALTKKGEYTEILLERLDVTVELTTTPPAGTASGDKKREAAALQAEAEAKAREAAELARVEEARKQAELALAAEAKARAEQEEAERKAAEAERKAEEEQAARAKREAELEAEAAAKAAQEAAEAAARAEKERLAKLEEQRLADEAAARAAEESKAAEAARKQAAPTVEDLDVQYATWEQSRITAIPRISKDDAVPASLYVSADSEGIDTYEGELTAYEDVFPPIEQQFNLRDVEDFKAYMSAKFLVAPENIASLAPAEISIKTGKYKPYVMRAMQDVVDGTRAAVQAGGIPPSAINFVHDPSGGYAASMNMTTGLMTVNLAAKQGNALPQAKQGYTVSASGGMKLTVIHELGHALRGAVRQDDYSEASEVDSASTSMPNTYQWKKHASAAWHSNRVSTYRAMAEGAGPEEVRPLDEYVRERSGGELGSFDEYLEYALENPDAPNGQYKSKSGDGFDMINVTTAMRIRGWFPSNYATVNLEEFAAEAYVFNNPFDLTMGSRRKYFYQKEGSQYTPAALAAMRAGLEHLGILPEDKLSPYDVNTWYNRVSVQPEAIYVKHAPTDE